MAGYENMRDGTRCSGAARRGAGSVIIALLLCACVSTPQHPQPPPLPATASPPPLDSSYDWHGLLLAPFGSSLKEIPVKLHEVLLFRDSLGPPQAEDAECYATEQTPPLFVARVPSEYLLCFKHDRLARVQAAVNLPRNEAVQIFADACALWQRNAGQEGAGSSACEGRDGVIDYAGQIDEEETQIEVPLTINLEASVQP